MVARNNRLDEFTMVFAPEFAGMDLRNNELSGADFVVPEKVKFAAPKLSELNLNNNRVGGGNFSLFPALISLRVSGNKGALEGYRFRCGSTGSLNLTGLTNLTTLNAEFSRFRSIPALSDLTNLRNVNLRWNCFTGFDGSRLTSLKTLNLDHNDVTCSNVRKPAGATLTCNQATQGK